MSKYKNKTNYETWCFYYMYDKHLIEIARKEKRLDTDFEWSDVEFIIHNFMDKLTNRFKNNGKIDVIQIADIVYDEA